MNLSDVIVMSSTMPYVPKIHVLKELWALDNGRLRVRWSDEMQKWCVERKIVHAIQYINSLSHYKKRFINGVWDEIENDSWIRARDGYILIGYHDATPHLDSWLIRNLRYYDIRRFSGGVKEVELLILREEEKKLEAMNRRHTREREDIAMDFYNDEVYRQGERVYVPDKVE